MEEIARVLTAIEHGNRAASAELLPLVYEELRRLAAKNLAQEKPGQTLQPTALVHEAYLRIVGGESADASWSSRSLFFGAAAEAMRRILIERARRKARLKHGGGVHRVEYSPDDLAGPVSDERLLEIDAAVARLEQEHPEKAEIVKLRFFAGLTNSEAAAVLGISTATAQRHWTFARLWLFSYLENPG